MSTETTTVTARANLSITRKTHGQMGDIETLGSHPTVDEAKQAGEDYARLSYPQGDLYWRQFSPRSWGLMLGSLYTYIRVSWSGDLPAVASPEAQAEH